MAYASWSVVFGEQPSAAKWNILGTNDAYFDSVVGSGTAWSSWTPTLSGRFDNTKWNKTCKYIQIGKAVFFRMYLLANNTTPMAGGTPEATFTLPVTSVSYPATGVDVLGAARYVAGGSATFGYAEWASTTTAQFRNYTAGGTYTGTAVITSTAPGTWTTNDIIAVDGFYEAA